MNFLLNKPFFLAFLMSERNNSTLSRKIINTSSRASHLAFGVFSAAIALPLVTFAVLFSVFLSEEKWEEFWDEFLEA